MNRYRVLQTSFIADSIREPGDIVTEADLNLGDGAEPGENLELIDPLDHDENGKKGGSKPRAAKSAAPAGEEFA